MDIINECITSAGGRLEKRVVEREAPPHVSGLASDSASTESSTAPQEEANADGCLPEMPAFGERSVPLLLTSSKPPGFSQTPERSTVRQSPDRAAVSTAAQTSQSSRIAQPTRQPTVRVALFIHAADGSVPSFVAALGEGPSRREAEYQACARFWDDLKACEGEWSPAALEAL